MPDEPPAPAIRRLIPDEWPLLRDIRLRALQDSPASFGSTYQREIIFTEEEWRARADRLVVASVGPTVIALAGWFERERGVIDLVAMWVSPEVRGTDVAERLVDAVETHALTGPEMRFELGVFAHNERAHRFYQRVGFVEFDRRPATSTGQLLIRMRRQTTAAPPVPQP